MAPRLAYRRIRDLHLYAGLFLSPFVLVYAVSAVLLNHAMLPWGGRENGDVRRRTVRVQVIDAAEGLAVAKDVQRQVAVRGEVGWVSRRPDAHRLEFPIETPGRLTSVRVDLATGLATVEQRETGMWDAAIQLHMRQLAIVGEVGETRQAPDGRQLDFQVVKPGRVYKVEARLDSARARVTEIRLDAWGVMDALHKFTGVRMDDPAAARDWWLTRLWSLAMDAVGAGLVVLVASGLYLWWRLVPRRAGGAVALALGVACCAFFLFGLGTLLG